MIRYPLQISYFSIQKRQEGVSNAHIPPELVGLIFVGDGFHLPCDTLRLELYFVASSDKPPFLVFSIFGSLLSPLIPDKCPPASAGVVVCFYGSCGSTFSDNQTELEALSKGFDFLKQGHVAFGPSIRFLPVFTKHLHDQGSPPCYSIFLEGVS